MPACPQHQETLWLDVYDELAASARGGWEAHLAGCEGCREEKVRMAKLLGTVKDAMQPPAMETPVANEMVRAIRRKLSPASHTPWWRPRMFGRPLGLVPAMAAFALLIMTVGVLSYRTLNSPSELTASAPGDTPTQVITADIELLKHMDLLRELDAVQKLVQVIDVVDSLPPDPNYQDNTQGKMFHGRQSAYVS